LMGVVSDAVLEYGGKVTGVMPYAMYAAGGEGDKVLNKPTSVEGEQSSKKQTVIVDSMHERKVEMAKRSVAFIGLPGGFGTYEEVFEVTTWTQIGIHHKPVVLLNVLSFFDPLRQLIRNGVKEGYINPSNESLIVFVDGPASHDDHEAFDWGTAALKAIEEWQGSNIKTPYNWGMRKNGSSSGNLDSV